MAERDGPDEETGRIIAGAGNETDGSTCDSVRAGSRTDAPLRVRAPFELEDMERGSETRVEDALQGEEEGVNLDGTIGNSLHSMDADMTFTEVSHGAGAVAVHGRVQ